MDGSKSSLGFGLTLPPARYRVQPRHGEAHGCAKLTQAKVDAIIASDEPQAVLAARYDVDQSRISRIKTRKAWRVRA